MPEKEKKKCILEFKNGPTRKVLGRHAENDSFPCSVNRVITTPAKTWTELIKNSIS